MNKLLSIALLALTSGCIVVDADGTSYEPYETYEPAPVYNASPELLYAEAGVYWDSYNRDDIWYFEADVDDLDGPRDVVEVWADVYDAFDGGLYIESFELFPTSDPWIWYSDWLGYSTWLDPYYHGYAVDFVVYDSFDEADYITVVPYTY
ncbi:MAG: hypothetical protein JXX28_07260 [Deltaproteobacteria bacterium]|nr:hypothetical protein [Deltaproteobacteria bacterium]